MQLATLRQPCFNSTLLGVVRGAADHYGLEVGTPALYGLTGHAWLLNIHRQLCPSGPYCWDRAPFYRLLSNVGLVVEPLGFFWSDGGPMPRADLEQRLRTALDEGLACFLVNMEYQLITGYDDTGLHTAQPWAPNMDFPQAHVTFGSWAEMGSEVHCDFHIIRPVTPRPLVEALAESLAWVRAAWAATDGEGDYGLGLRGYALWRQAVRDGHGESHGNWWNATVYAECRAQVAPFLREVAAQCGGSSVVEPLAAGYERVAALLQQAADKALPAETKLDVLAEAESLERELSGALPMLA